MGKAKQKYKTSKNKSKRTVKSYECEKRIMVIVVLTFVIVLIIINEILVQPKFKTIYTITDKVMEITFVPILIGLFFSKFEYYNMQIDKIYERKERRKKKKKR